MPAASHFASQCARVWVTVTASTSGSRAARFFSRLGTVSKRGSSIRCGRPSSVAKRDQRLALAAPTVKWPSLARNAWYGAFSRCAVPSPRGTSPVYQYCVASHWLSATPASKSDVSMSWPRRSEEHTSELQSLAYLVCRLLLEKKKKKITQTPTDQMKNNPYNQQH